MKQQIWLYQDMQLYIINDLILLQKLQIIPNTMSKSSLPQIFAKGHISPVFTSRQGSPYKIHLETYQSTIDQRSANRPQATLTPRKERSASISQGQSKQTVSRGNKAKRFPSPQGKMDIFQADAADWATMIHPKKKSAISVLSASNFPFETHLKLNSVLQTPSEALGLANQTDHSIKQIQVILKSLNETKNQTIQTRKQIKNLGFTLLQQLSNFQSQFEDNLIKCYSKLSQLRRQTNLELKGNRQQLEKLCIEISDCSHLEEKINQTSQKMYNFCLSLPDKPRQTADSTERACSPGLDFEGISTIPKQSRGATREGHVYDRKIHSRATSDLLFLSKPTQIIVNGKQIQLNNFED